MVMHAFQTVTQAEIDKLLAKSQFKNLFSLLKRISSLDGYPKNWLITSIDTSSADGKPREAYNSPSHYESNAVDIVPLNDKMRISLPIPLNRNLLLMRTFKVAATEYGNDLPIIAFEADHIHCDIFHSPGVAYFTKAKKAFDSNVFKAIEADTTGILKKALHSKQIVYV